MGLAAEGHPPRRPGVAESHLTHGRARMVRVKGRTLTERLLEIEKRCRQRI